jgi:hypothetical protein
MLTDHFLLAISQPVWYNILIAATFSSLLFSSLLFSSLLS